MTVVDVQEYRLKTGTDSRTLYIGAMPVESLDQYARVPSFSPTTDQFEIAKNVLSPPVRDWQRPPNDQKIEAIRVKFSQPGEFMPNPVLLAVAESKQVDVKPKYVNGQATGLFELSLTLGPDDEEPLWILDGQHRVAGLASSTQSKNVLPFVLLHDVSGSYQPQHFARIFAQVSTEATPLEPLHAEWLQFAFKLDEYDPQKTSGRHAANLHNQAMETVLRLCNEQSLNGFTNRFFNRIQLNPHRPPEPAHGQGFGFSAIDLKNIVLGSYYAAQALGPHQSPATVASALSGALNSLVGAVSTPSERSAFFGRGNKHHKAVEVAFVQAVLARFAQDPTTDWDALLQDLGFDTADWDFAWVRTTGGNAGNTSKRVASDVFVESMTRGTLPTGATSLVDVLQGDEASFQLTASSLTPTGHASRTGKKNQTFATTATKSFTTRGQPHIKFSDKSVNVGSIEVRDPSAPHSTEYSYSNLKKGKVVPVGRKELHVQCEFYGGVTSMAKITVVVAVE